MASSSGANVIMGLSTERIERSLAASLNAHKKPDRRYFVEINPQEVIISFPASRGGAFKDWYSNTTFGETEIDLKQFPSLKSIGKNESALVNKYFLQRFKEMLEKSSFEDEVKKEIEKKKQIVFAGHSSGGPVAILATLWAIETCITPKLHEGNHPLYPLCVTFGSPLIGDHIFSHAIRRENWSTYFFHFVMRYDIVPRILLAPLSSFDKKFEEVSQLIDPIEKSLTSESSDLGKATEILEFYSKVMSNAATVTRHAACRLMGTTEATLETIANFVPLSLYRPFGTYIFCTTSGNESKQIVMKNPDAILQVMFFSAQLGSKAEIDEVFDKSLQQHFSYDTELGKNLKPNVWYLDNLENFTSSGGDIATMNTALNDFGLRTRAILCIHAADALEEWKRNNEISMKEKICSVEDSIDKLYSYRKTTWDEKKGYYDAFKDQQDTKDYQANLKRLELAGVWDEIIEKLSNYELPDDFEGKKEWIKRGTKFRRLVEPLDIANYYRHLRNRDGHIYMARGARPKRYRYTQRWLEHDNKRERNDDVYSESCFWAEVEELCYNNDNSFEDVKNRVLDLEKQIAEWYRKDEVDKDVFVKDSTFDKWWKTLPIQHKEESCIKDLVEV